jgi:heme A synthase
MLGGVAHHMKRSFDSSLLWIVAAVFTAYVGAYVAYRFAGPAQKVWPKDGTPHAIVLVSSETTLRTALAYLFYPCIAAEGAYYRSHPD